VLGRARRAGGFLSTTAAAIFLACACPPADAASAPKLTAHAETPVVNSGEQITLSLTATNRSKSTSGKLSLRLLMSADRRESKGDVPLKGKVKVPALRPHKSKTVGFSAPLPPKLEPGAYSVLICAAKCRPMKGTVGVGPPAQRIDVSPGLAPDDAASAPIGTDGGRLDAFAADGTLYSLIFPAGALASPTQITMTPLVSLGGSPLGSGLVGGVQLEPDGLELAKAATLVIQGDRIAPGPGQVAFGYHGAGQDYHLEPLYRQPPPELDGQYDPSKSVLVPVAHFSGTGVQPATDIDTVRDLRYGAMEARDRLAEQAAKAIQKERDGGESATPELERVLSDYLDQVVIPDAAAASFSDALFANGLQSYISWQRQRQLLGIEGDFAARIAQVEKLLDQAFKALVKRLSDRCRAGDLAIQTRVLSLERQLQLLGVDDHAAEFAELIDKCYRFELRVTSHLEHHGDADLGGGWTAKDDYSIELQGAAPLTVGGYLGTGELGGVGPFDYRQSNISGSGRVDFGAIGYNECTYYGTGVNQPGQLSVLGGTLPYKAGETGGAEIPASILIDPGSPQEEVHWDCQGAVFGQPSSSSENQWEENWLRYFRSTHQGDSQDQAGGTGPWLLHDFKPGRHPIIAEQTLTFDSPQYAYSLTETFQLVHTPLEGG
jgi:hypothetical protein